MIEKENWDNIFHREINKKDKRKLTDNKLKEESDNIKMSNKKEDSNNMKEIKNINLEDLNCQWTHEISKRPYKNKRKTNLR